MRKMLGVLSLFFAVGMVSKSFSFLGQALALRSASQPVEFRQQYIQEYLLSFALLLTVGLVLGGWGIAQFRRRRPKPLDN